jgi:hypothetical protein
MLACWGLAMRRSGYDWLAWPSRLSSLPYSLCVPGIFTLGGGGVQIPPGGLVLTEGEDGAATAEIRAVRVRLDLWPTWLEIGCRATNDALAACQQLSADLSDDTKASLLTSELQGGLVAVTAFAFSMDGFYDTSRNELGPHPDEASWKKNRTARASQVSETLRYHLKLGPNFSRQLRQCVEELFQFRGRAVHSDGKWVEPNFRPEIDSGVHPYLITFSGPHARQCRAMTLLLVDRLVSRAASVSPPDTDTGWLKRGREELDRLSALYRVLGDEHLAFPVAPPRLDADREQI